jgi:hypothetical protein
VPGYPIRTPWDHSSVDSSPRPIAASHVLHRLLVPRHPPYALSNLTTQHHHSNDTNGAATRALNLAKRKTDHTPPTRCDPAIKQKCLQRCSHPLCNSQPTPNPHRTTATTHRHTSEVSPPMQIQPNQPNAGCLRTQQDVCTPPPNRTTRRLPHSSRCRTHAGDRCRPGTSTSVSANEHPTTTTGRHGLLTPLQVQGAP